MKKLTEEQIKEFYIRKDNRHIRESKNRYVIVNEWYTGGMSGGSCWNDNAPEYRSSGEGKPRFKLLRDIIKTIDPNISFLNSYYVNPSIEEIRLDVDLELALSRAKARVESGDTRKVEGYIKYLHNLMK